MVFHVSHVRLVLGLDLSKLGLLIGGEDLHHFRLDAGVLDLDFDHGLRVLRGEGASLDFIERTAGLKRAHSRVVLVHLLHQRLESGLLFLPNGLDLGLLIAGEIESASEESEHMVEAAAAATMTVHALGNRGCHRQQHSGADGENADTSRFHWNSFWISLDLDLSGGSGGSPNVYTDKNTILENMG